MNPLKIQMWQYFKTHRRLTISERHSDWFAVVKQAITDGDLRIVERKKDNEYQMLTVEVSFE